MKQPKAKFKNVGVRMPIELANQIKAQAKQELLTPSAFIRRTLHKQIQEGGSNAN